MRAVVGVPGGKLNLEVGKAEGLHDRLGKVDAGHHFVFNLAGGAEDVRVVLRKAAHAHQAVHCSRAFVAVDAA